MAKTEIKRKSKEKITVSHRLNSEEYRLWSILLANASHEFFSKPDHQIELQPLIHAWSKNKSLNDLKKCLIRLSLMVQYTYIENRTSIRGGFALLSWAEIDPDEKILTYGYARKFKDFTHHPKIGCFLNLLGLNYCSPITTTTSLFQNINSLNTIH